MEVIQALLPAVAITAGITSIIIDSPLGSFIRANLAGSPSNRELEQRRLDRLDDDTLPLLQAESPWLDEALRCQACVSFWIAAAISAGFPDAAWGILMPATWLLSRLALALVRLCEYRADG